MVNLSYKIKYLAPVLVLNLQTIVEVKKSSGVKSAKSFNVLVQVILIKSHILWLAAHQAIYQAGSKSSVPAKLTEAPIREIL
jgi:hypothetical protein